MAAVLSPWPPSRRSGTLPYLPLLRPSEAVLGVCGRFYGRDPRGEGRDDTPVLPIGLFEGPNAILQLGYQQIRTVVRLVVDRTRLVVGRTAFGCGIEEDV